MALYWHLNVGIVLAFKHSVLAFKHSRILEMTYRFIISLSFRYLKGRLTYPQINSAIDQINQVLAAKFKILRTSRAGMSEHVMRKFNVSIVLEMSKHTDRVILAGKFLTWLTRSLPDWPKPFPLLIYSNTIRIYSSRERLWVWKG